MTQTHQTHQAIPAEDEAATTADLNAAADALEHTLDDEDGPDPRAAELADKIETAQAAQQDAHQRGELFDPAEYTSEELALPQVDGHGIDKIRVAFGGSIMLDRSNPDHVALFRKLELGKDVEFRVAGDVTSVSTGWTTGKEGDLDAIVGERKIKVSTVYLLTPEEL